MCSAVKHVEVEGLLVFEQEHHVFADRFRRHARPRLAPVREPAGINFAAEHRHARIHAASEFKVLEFQTGIKAHGATRQRAGFEHVRRGAVAGREGHCDAELPPQVVNPLHIRAVIPVAAVLVFYLKQDDRSASTDLPRADQFGQSLAITLRRRCVARIHAAHFQIRVAQQVGRHCAEIILGATIRSGPQKQKHPLRLDQPEELRQVACASLEIESPLGHLVMIPENVSGNGVQPHRLRHADAMPPILLRDAVGMNLSGPHLKRLAVQQEIIRAKRKGVRRGFCRGSQDGGTERQASEGELE